MNYKSPAANPNLGGPIGTTGGLIGATGALVGTTGAPLGTAGLGIPDGVTTTHEALAETPRGKLRMPALRRTIFSFSTIGRPNLFLRLVVSTPSFSQPRALPFSSAAATYQQAAPCTPSPTC
jgi:hypothetical protein